MKKSLLVLAVVAAFAPVLAQAEAGDFVVRLRATNVNPSVSSNLGAQTNATYASSSLADTLYGSNDAKLEVGSNTIPELDISYYFTKNIAAELILALGTRHDVNVSGTTGAVAKALGSVNLLPPTLTAQWHFMPDQTFDPYVGAGLAYVRAMDNGLNAHTSTPADYAIRIDRNNFGTVLQAGFDVNLKDKWLVNFDVKKVFVSTDVELNLDGTFKKIDSLDINPLVVSVGFGKKF
jgi:outer membrane protein